MEGVIATKTLRHAFRLESEWEAIMAAAKQLVGK